MKVLLPAICNWHKKNNGFVTLHFDNHFIFIIEILQT